MKDEKLIKELQSIGEKIDLILRKIDGNDENVGDSVVLDIKEGKICEGKPLNKLDFLIEKTTYTDEYANEYVILPPIYVRKMGDSKVLVSLSQFLGGIELKPQMISRYKNSLIDGQCRSIPNVAPNFTQFSYNKSKKFAEWVGGEIMNWETQLYIQLVYLAIYGTKKNDACIPNEDYHWNEERDCAFGDTGKGIGEFLGIEQLFTSGRNFISFDGRDGKLILWDLYKEINFDSNFNPNMKYGIWGDYDKNPKSFAPFRWVWTSDFVSTWNSGSSGLRLCKTYLEYKENKE